MEGLLLDQSAEVVVGLQLDLQEVVAVGCFEVLVVVEECLQVLQEVVAVGYLRDLLVEGAVARQEGQVAEVEFLRVLLVEVVEELNLRLEEVEVCLEARLEEQEHLKGCLSVEH